MPEIFRPKLVSNPDLSDAGAVLHQLSYQTKSKLVIMWIEDWPVDDECVSIHMMLMHEIHVSELRSETNFKCVQVFLVTT